MQILEGDSRDVLPTIEDNSIDACVTDPPYALNFMGREWDIGETVYDRVFWFHVLRVLKPGGHLVAFGGTRTSHRMICAIEDAGFEIRDQLCWLYGSGFPKSHDVSKGIDKAAGAEPIVTGDFKRASIQRNGKGETWNAGAFASHPEATKQVAITAPATDAAIQWSGWGTALKPACEPICLARKPLSEGTIAANVLRWGTGALNIDGCRVESGEQWGAAGDLIGRDSVHDYGDGLNNSGRSGSHAKGRWPANVVHNGSDEVVGMFPETTSGDLNRVNGSGDGYGMKGRGDIGHIGDSGSAARFFYSAKADSDDRLGSRHPTVKPVDLMQWLCRLVTPPQGIILDPFAGSGTTGEAAYREGFSSILIERDPAHIADIRRRLALLNSGPDERKRESIKARLADTPPDYGPLFAYMFKEQFGGDEA